MHSRRVVNNVDMLKLDNIIEIPHVLNARVSDVRFDDAAILVDGTGETGKWGASGMVILSESLGASFRIELVCLEGVMKLGFP